MLRLTRIHSARGATKYFDAGLSASDYYLSERGQWGGKGAERLGLAGDVARDAFLALASNKVPGSGERLTVRTKTTRVETVTDKKTGKTIEREVSNRRAGYDFTFAVPKSVSLYLALNDDKALEGMIHAAFKETIGDIENEIQTHIHAKGEDGRPTEYNRVSGNLVYASFVHRETRPVDGIPDPHYHIHGFVMNATWVEAEQRWKALEIGETAANRTCYEARFFHRLADKLLAAGYGIRRTDTHFELASVSRELIEKFSKRTKLIEELARQKYTILDAEARALMKQTGMAFDDAFAQVLQEREKAGDLAEMKSGIGGRNRERKEAAKFSSREELVANWVAQMITAELDSLKPKRVKAARSENLLDPETAGTQTIEQLFEHVSVKRIRHVEASLLRLGLGRVSIDEARAFPLEDPRFVRPDPTGKLVTTWEVRSEEEATIQTGRAGQGKYEPLGRNKSWEIQNALVANDPQQRGALEFLLRSHDLVMSIRGPAGAGKTTFAVEAIRAIETLSGSSVLVLAPSSSAAQELKKRGLINAETFQQFQVNSILQEAARGAVLWIDEAGFLSVKQGRWLLDFALANNCRLITPGDTKQHHSVERGDWLRIMERAGAIRYAAITKIFRQQVPALRDAVYELSQGRTEVGFDKLDKFGAIEEIADKDARLAAIAQKQLEAIKEKKSSLIVAPTHSECRTIAEAVRSRMKEKGLLSRVEQTFVRLGTLNLIEAERRDPVNYEPGQVVEFHRIVKSVAVAGKKEKCFRSGERWKVLARDAVGNVIVQRGNRKQLLPLEHAKRFGVYEPVELRIAVGEQIRITKNFRCAGTKFRNNEFHRVTAVEEGKITLGGGQTIQADFLHIDQGIAVTSHASQGRTVDQIIASAPVEAFSQVNQAQFYVSMSRARYAMHLFTDSKVALREAVCRPSERLSPWELFEGRKPIGPMPAIVIDVGTQQKEKGITVER